MNVPGRLPGTFLFSVLLLGAAVAHAAEEPAATAKTDPAAPSVQENPSSEQTEAEIARLIEQLGDDEFLLRERAQTKLQQYGATAFDALLAAQDHEDIEIASRAYYLVRAISVEWILPGDSEPLRECLENYSETEPEDREAILEVLSESEASDWPAGLSRIVRFEPSERLSKKAALLLVERQYRPDGFDDKGELAGQVDRELGLCRRPGAEWLRLYLQAAGEPSVLAERWEEILRREESVLDCRPDRSSKEIVREMLFWFVEALQQDQRPAEAEKAMQRLARTIDVEDEQAEQTVKQVLHRCLLRNTWGVVPHLARRAPKLFEEDWQLLYYLAGSHVRAGQAEQAERLAQKAFETFEQPPNQEVEWLATMRYSRGALLNYLGLSPWAEREYRAAVELVPVGSAIGVRARLALAAMYDEDLEYLKAAETLKPLVEQFEKDTELGQLLRGDLEREPEEIRASMHYYYAEHHGQKGEPAEQARRLDEAIRIDPTNIDALIALYRLDKENPERREKMLEHLNKAIAKYKSEIEVLEKQHEAIPASDELQLTLSNAYNTYAWLVACTEGDLQDALRCSRESLKLHPDHSAILDTLARCYFAVGDYETALKHQQRAVAMTPYSPPLQRQLKMIREALEKKQKGAT